MTSLRLEYNLTREKLMSIQLHAKLYDLCASGFYFGKENELQNKFKSNKHDYGESVEDYEIQFTDGDDLECALAKAIGLNQANFAAFFESAGAWGRLGKDKQYYSYW